MTATATTNCRSGSTPMNTPSASGKLAISIAPALSRRLSAVKTSSSPFWMMTDSPNVTSSGGSRSSPSVRLRSARCST